MKCGHCKSLGVTVSHVRSCAGTAIQPATTAPSVVWSGIGGAARATVVTAPVAVLDRPTAPVVSVARATEIMRDSYPYLDEHAGMYRDPSDDKIYKVQKAVHGSGHLYAKILVVHGPGSAEFDMAPGAVRRLRLAWRMSLDEAKQYGALYGVCVRCGRTLTDEYSIANGIGPICAGKMI